MFQRCPSCNYDLVGLAGATQCCPECGTSIDSPSVRRAWNRRVTRRWTLFLLTPVFALPGLILMGVGFPLISLILGSVFAHHAFELEARLRGEPSKPIRSVCSALLLSLVWTIASCAILWFLLVSVLVPLID